MLLPAGVVDRTRAFYEWELRGRGWAVHPHPVVLEPPFRPFLGHVTDPAAAVDDARRPTWLSSLLDGLRAQEGPADEPSLVTAEEPPERDPRAELSRVVRVRRSCTYRRPDPRSCNPWLAALPLNDPLSDLLRATWYRRKG